MNNIYFNMFESHYMLSQILLFKYSEMHLKVESLWRQGFSILKQLIDAYMNLSVTWSISWFKRSDRYRLAEITRYTKDKDDI